MLFSLSLHKDKSLPIVLRHIETLPKLLFLYFRSRQKTFRNNRNKIGIQEGNKPDNLNRLVRRLHRKDWFLYIERAKKERKTEEGRNALSSLDRFTFHFSPGFFFSSLVVKVYYCIFA